MGDGSGDLQKSWHAFFGKYFYASSILDVGAGLGKSKPRLQYNLNDVVTQDINPARKGLVDILAPIEILTMTFDYVISFDVMEHVSRLKPFLEQKNRIAIKGVLDTTPNWYLYPKAWHFTSEHFDTLYRKIYGKQEYVYFFRINNATGDYVKEVTRKEFLDDKKAYAYGILMLKRS